MLDKYFALIKDNDIKRKLFIESVLDVCNKNKTKEEIEEDSILKAENFNFKFIVNKDDFLKIKIIANSSIKFLILQNKDEIQNVFKEKMQKEILVLII